MNNQNQPLTKELLIKRFLLVVGSAVAFAIIALFFTYGRIPIKPFLIGLVILLSIMAVNAIIIFKYKEKIAQNQNIFSYLLIIIGIGMIITSIKGGKLYTNRYWTYIAFLWNKTNKKELNLHKLNSTTILWTIA